MPSEVVISESSLLVNDREHELIMWLCVIRYQLSVSGIYIIQQIELLLDFGRDGVR